MPTPSETHPAARARRLLVTAGPTHEPIDTVRYIGNRSSGRLGIALADAAAASGQRSATSNSRATSSWQVTLLLGPTSLTPADTRVRLRRFLTTADLQALLDQEVPNCDVLVMAAAVADYRPRPIAADHGGKIRRTEGPLTIEMESTPDLLAGIGRTRRPDQMIVGFALEPRDRLLESARSKLVRKRLDMIVANPLETMDAPTIEATVLASEGVVHQSQTAVTKEVFACTLLELIEQRMASATIGAQR